MKKLSLLLLSLLLLVLPLRAQPTIADAFGKMPLSLMPYLTLNNRLDLIDFVGANMEAKVTNLLGGQTRLKVLTADSLLLELSPKTTVVLRLLPVAEAVDSAHHVVCMVTTLQLSAGIYEQTARCFSLKWRELDDGELPADVAAILARYRRSTLLEWDDERLSKKPV